MKLNLENKNIIVTGGNGFIGREIIKSLLEEKANLISSCSSEEKSVELNHQYENQVKWHKCDFSLEKDIVNYINYIKQHMVTIDGVVNCVGCIEPQYIRWMTKEQWSKVININLSGSFYLLRECSKYMNKRECSSFVSISSISDLHGSPTHVNYAASKAGLNAMTVVAAKEMGPMGIRVNTISAGPLDGGTLNSPERIKKQMKRDIPLRRLGNAGDVANLACFLLSERSSFITGQSYVVDGGLTL